MAIGGSKPSPVVTERRNSIRNKLVSNPGVIFKYSDIRDEFNLSKNVFAYDMSILRKEDPHVVMQGGQLYYDISDKPIIHEVKKPERYGKMKSHECHTDLTAAKAIESLCAEARGMIFPKAGDVWHVQGSNNSGTKLFIVLAVDVSGKFATCIEYLTKDSPEDRELYLCTKPLKYFSGNERAWTMPLSYMTVIRNRLRDMFAIEPEEKIVEVEKIKEVEVPVKVESKVDTTGLYTQAEVDALLSEQKAEIYEKCFTMIAKSR